MAYPVDIHSYLSYRYVPEYYSYVRTYTYIYPAYFPERVFIYDVDATTYIPRHVR